MLFNNSFEIDEVMINDDVFTSPFACDLQNCKGACCTLKSDYGAPLTLEEIETIKNILPVVIKYLPEAHKEEITQNNFYANDGGDYFTQSVNRKDCVFVFYDGDVAKCSIEKAFFNKEVTFRKPISCHLFPIRISNFGGDVLRYEKFSECKSAVAKGKESEQTVFQFCEGALLRNYGSEWFQKVKEEISQRSL